MNLFGWEVAPNPPEPEVACPLCTKRLVGKAAQEQHFDPNFHDPCREVDSWGPIEECALFNAPVDKDGFSLLLLEERGQVRLLEVTREGHGLTNVLSEEAALVGRPVEGPKT